MYYSHVDGSNRNFTCVWLAELWKKKNITAPHVLQSLYSYEALADHAVSCFQQFSSLKYALLETRISQLENVESKQKKKRYQSWIAYLRMNSYFFAVLFYFQFDQKAVNDHEIKTNYLKLYWHNFKWPHHIHEIWIKIFLRAHNLWAQNSNWVYFKPLQNEHIFFLK